MPKKENNGYPIPDVIDPPESMSVTLCVPKNRDHLATFFGALYELTIWTSWQKNAAHSAVEVADVWSRYWNSWDRNLNDIDCEDGMAKCCVEPIREQRVNPVTGRPEVRYDGGEWQPDPYDPQFAVMVQPAIVGEGLPSTKCDAASNALQHFTDLVSAMSSNIATASSVYDLAVAIATIIIQIMIIVATGGAGTGIALTIAGLVWGAGSAAFTAGQAAFDEYWDSDALDIVFCALYCNIGENGQFTEDQYNAFLTDVRFELPSSPARDFVMTAITAGGAAGLSNMASYGGSADSDCAECGCDDTQRVWFQNAGGNIDGTGVEIFPDSEGVYTVTCDSFYVNGYYGIIKFALDPVTDGFVPCGDIVVLDAGGAGLGYTGDCETGDNNPLSHCFSYTQYYKNVPWTMTFTIAPC